VVWILASRKNPVKLIYIRLTPIHYYIKDLIQVTID